jgi:hypothetical protein
MIEVVKENGRLLYFFVNHITMIENRFGIRL